MGGLVRGVLQSPRSFGAARTVEEALLSPSTWPSERVLRVRGVLCDDSHLITDALVLFYTSRTRVDAPRLETRSLSSSVLVPGYASDRLSGSNRDPILKPKRSHRKADPDAAHR